MAKIQRWPLAIAISYILFVLLLLAFLAFSRFNTVDLVSEDYYAQELKYQEQIERINRSRSLKQPLQWQYDRSENTVRIQFPVRHHEGPVSGSIVFFRPANASQDLTYRVKPIPDGSQILNTGHLSKGLWRIKIFWRADDFEYYDEFVIFIE